MEFTFRIDNNKEVLVRELLMSDIRDIVLYSEDSTITGYIKHLEKFILTPSLNVADKLKTFLKLREKCIGTEVSVSSKKGQVNVELDYINKNIGYFDDITETCEVDGIIVTLDYPFKFNVGDTDFLFSCISKLKIGDDDIIMSKLDNESYSQIIDRLPKSIFKYVERFIENHSHNFEFKVIEARERLGIQEVTLNLLSTNTPTFIFNIFNCMSDNEYRDTIFKLSKRLPDTTFLLNSSFLEIKDYFNLYKEEIERENEELQKQNNR